MATYDYERLLQRDSALQRQLDEMRRMENLVRQHRAVLDATAAEAILADYRTLQAERSPIHEAMERLREDARWRERLRVERSVTEEAAARARELNALREAHDQALSRTFANFLREQQQVRLAAERFFTPSLTSALMAVLRNTQALGAQAIPNEWRSLSATFRQALAAAPTAADYDRIRRAYDLGKVCTTA
jgi:hypothetical protein